LPGCERVARLLEFRVDAGAEDGWFGGCRLHEVIQRLTCRMGNRRGWAGPFPVGSGARLFACYSCREAYDLPPIADDQP
jgi:hypothetical protein